MAFAFGLPLGKARRSDKQAQAAARFALALRHLGFIVTEHFPFRWAERAIAAGTKAGPETFAGWFAAGRHYDDRRPNRNVRFVVTPLGIVVYRLAGPRGGQVKIITFYDRMPPDAVPRRAPRLAGGRVVA